MRERVVADSHTTLGYIHGVPHQWSSVDEAEAAIRRNPGDIVDLEGEGWRVSDWGEWEDLCTPTALTTIGWIAEEWGSEPSEWGLHGTVSVIEDPDTPARFVYHSDGEWGLEAQYPDGQWHPTEVYVRGGSIVEGGYVEALARKIAGDPGHIREILDGIGKNRRLARHRWEESDLCKALRIAIDEHGLDPSLGDYAKEHYMDAWAEGFLGGDFK